MADYTIDEISEIVKSDILAESQGVGEVPVVTSLVGINSLPALRGNEVVEAPLSLLSKPAEDAAKAAYDAISDVDTATSNAVKAAGTANEAAERVNEAILNLEEEKAIIANVDEAEQIRIANENTRISNENERKTAEEERKSSENTRTSSENARKLAETARVEAENIRETNESTRKTAENERNTQEQSRRSAENVRRTAEVQRENVKAEMVALNQELKTHPPVIDTSTYNWKIWDAVNKTYVDTGITGQGRTPIIIEGVWWIWDDLKDEYVSTGYSVNSDYVLTRDNVVGVVGGYPMMLTEWNHSKTPYNKGTFVKFNQEFFVALDDTELPPVPLVLLADGTIAKVDEHTYATLGTYDAVGYKDLWRKLELDELRLISREGTLDGAEVDVRELSVEDVYRFEPNLAIDFVKGTIKGKKVDLKLPKKNVTDALGYEPLSEARIDQLFDEKALDVLQGSDVLAIESNGKKATVTVDMLKSFFNTYDLSRHDIYGNAIKQTTANCYVVKNKGYYSFPLVYGNALKNGEVNTPAFTKVEGTYSMDFVNHLDNVITSPYIEQHEGCQPVSVELSLCDTKDVFGAFRLVGKDDCTYVEFEVINVPKTGANGVVSIIDANGDAIWSWHIWLWEDDLTPVTITNATNVNYDILPVNLASKWDEDSKTHIKNWFYQWGRHIPMLSPAAYNSNADAANYGKRAFGKVSKAASYGVGLKNPWNFYCTTDVNWFGNSFFFNLWDASCVDTGTSDKNVVKTVYDPSPIGFKIPNGNVFSYFSSANTIGVFANGWSFKKKEEDNQGVFFPATGNRNYASGIIQSIGIVGYVWEAESPAYQIGKAYFLYFDADLIIPANVNVRGIGYSVRPVKE